MKRLKIALPGVDDVETKALSSNEQRSSDESTPKGLFSKNSEGTAEENMSNPKGASRKN